jgi:hypothetical protein
MHDSADGISVSLDDVAVRLRAIAGRRTEFPSAASVAVFGGPSGTASADYRRALGRVARELSALTSALTTQLTQLEESIVATTRDLVAADESAAGDVNALTWMLDTVEEPVTTTDAAPGPAPGGSSAAQFT